MAEQSITVGGKTFEVVCQDGEEHLLQAAAAMLDAEAQTVLNHGGRVPDARMLLMAGLLLADRTAAADDGLAEAQARIAALEVELAALKSAPPPDPQRVEVPVIPDDVTDTLAELAARAEAVAAKLEEAAAPR